MDSLPQSPHKSSLSAAEREVIVTYNDAAKVWTVYSDSVTMRGAIVRLARHLRAEVRPVGDHGVEFAVPAEGLRLAAKPRHPGRASNLQKSGSDRAPKSKVAILDRPMAGL